MLDDFGQASMRAIMAQRKVEELEKRLSELENMTEEYKQLLFGDEQANSPSRKIYRSRVG